MGIVLFVSGEYGFADCGKFEYAAT